MPLVEQLFQVVCLARQKYQTKVMQYYEDMQEQMVKNPDDAASNTSNIRKFGGSVVSSERKLSLQLNDDDGPEPLSAPPRGSFVSHKRTTSMDSNTDLQALLAEDSSRIMQMNKKLSKKATKSLKGVVKA